MKYKFYYDESEHSRIINHTTVTADAYYDNFVTAIVGWRADEEKEMERQYLEFEEKYAFRKKNGELKSDTFRLNRFKYGFASFNKDNAQMLNDFFSIFDEECCICFSLGSKIEFIIEQLFQNYQNSIFVDMDKIRYSIVKAIIVYRPLNVIDSLYKTPKDFVDSLTDFLEKRIEINRRNLELKRGENEAFENILIVLQDVTPPVTFAWDYHMPFIGFEKFLKSKHIVKYELIIDKEGEAGQESKTLLAAKECGLIECKEADSKEYFGIRMADMLAGVVTKLLKALRRALTPVNDTLNIGKTLLDKSWFQLNANQLLLYKKLYYIFFSIKSDWYKIYAGNYSDDLVCLLGLLEFMNQFDTVDDMKEEFDMMPEYCNSCMYSRLERYFGKMENKLPVEPIIAETEESYRNQRGGKVYFDTDKQPFLPLREGENKYNVLSVGFSGEKVPLVTIEEKNENICYRLPAQLYKWALTLVAMSSMGTNLFPSEVIFTKKDSHVYVDIL